MLDRTTTKRLSAASLLLLAAALATPGCATRIDLDGPPAQADPITAAERKREGIIATEPWAFGGDQGQIIRTQHYRLYTTATDRRDRDRIALFLEDALQHYTTALAPLPLPPVKLDTYYMANRVEWEQITLRLMGEAGRELSAIQRGGFASRGIGVYYDLGLYDTLAIASHEGWHQYTQRTFRNPLPAWLEEGIATYMEGHRWNDGVVFTPWGNPERYQALRDAHSQNKLFTLQELLSTRPQDHMKSTDDTALLRYYAQVWALTHFLVEGEHGRHRAMLRSVLEDAAAGNLAKRLADTSDRRASASAMATRNGPLVFATLFDSDLERANRAYQAFVSQIVAVGARDAIGAGRSPLDGPH
jgi:hypothetical protein